MTIRNIGIGKILLFAALPWALLAGAQADDGKGASVRPEVGKPVSAAIDLLKAKKGRDSLVKLRDAEAVAGKSAYESYLIARVKGQAAASAGEPAVAAEAFEAALASPAMPAAERPLLLAGLAGQYYSAKSYGKAAEACDRYFKEGGNDPAMHTLQVQSYYLAGDLARAAREIQADIQSAERDGKVPPEQSLQILADISNRQKDMATFLATMEKLVGHYPKPDYWASVVYAVTTKPGLSQQLALDVLRLKLATHTLRVADEYVEAAQYALQAGFPVEAKRFLDAGYAANKLGSGPEAERHKRLRDSTEKKLAEDVKGLAQDERKATQAADGNTLLNTGLNYVLHGQADKGLPLMAQGLKKGGFKRPEDAKLHYGMALILAGDKTKGIETLRGVTGADGPADLARLWILAAQHL
jgi:outer membrane protein assembly factor BamD (BamD/ComL family)